jgi:hypothetical protein
MAQNYFSSLFCLGHPLNKDRRFFPYEISAFNGEIAILNVDSFFRFLRKVRISLPIPYESVKIFLLLFRIVLVRLNIPPCYMDGSALPVGIQDNAVFIDLADETAGRATTPVRTGTVRTMDPPC